MICQKLRQMGDHFTAGFLEGDDCLLNALIEQLRYGKLPQYTNTHLYPLSLIWGSGILSYSYSYSAILNEKSLQQSPLSHEEKSVILDKFNSIYKGGSLIEEKYILAGRGYTHFCPELKAFVDGNLTDYLASFCAPDMLNGKLSLLCEAVIDYVNRIIHYLSTFNTPRAKRLVEAYSSLLYKSSQTFFDAFVRILFIFALDGFDSLGGVDAILGNFELDKDAKQMFAELYRAYESTNAWNMSLGDNYDVSAVALSAFDGASRPNFSIKVDENTPQFLWEACFDAIKRGCRPAFYNKKAFQKAMRNCGVAEEHLQLICYGGCSETMIAGQSNVGSIDGGINLAEILCQVLREESYPTFEALQNKYLLRIEEELTTLTKQCNEDMLAMSNCPQYVRTLLCPPCAESKREFQGGGAKYNFSVINLCALANVADSLYAIEELVFRQGRFTLEQVIQAMEDDFADESYLSAVKRLEFFGNDNDGVDDIASRIFNHACNVLEGCKTAYGNGSFLPACIMFDTAIPTGKITSATPDGRKKGRPISDSGGAMTGCDHVSPTALLNSVAKINPQRASGTWIVNLALSQSILEGQSAQNAFKALVLCYFANGGNQLQLNVIDRQKLLQAIDDDDLASTIIVRVGGFSERFSNLTREFRKAIASRTQY